MDRRFVIILAGALIVLYGVLIGRVHTEMQQTAGDLAVRLSALEKTVDLLASDTAATRAAFLAEGQKQAEEQSTALAEVQKSLAGQGVALKGLSQTSDIGAVVREWSPFVYRLVCAFDRDGDTATSSGSATLETFPYGTRTITSKHVIEFKGGNLEGCTLKNTTTNNSFDIGSDGFVDRDPDRDLAFGTLAAAAPGMSPSRVCAGKPAIGDRVVILGYPSIGGTESITATEGIVSGFDGEYYTTSAKIERGNSGGAAIDVSRSCFLGLPTLVLAGQVESLARILPLTP